jgi:hypothetical protein
VDEYAFDGIFSDATLLNIVFTRSPNFRSTFFRCEFPAARCDAVTRIDFAGSRQRNESCVEMRESAV